MADFIAVKKLSASDLTLLDRFFGVINKSGQKCINLNADVFVDVFYPSIEALTAQANGEAKVNLTLMGPAAKGPLNLTRKVTKGDTYKNWRLNGETIHDPKADPDRFAPLQKDDLAIIAFEGIGVPTALRIVFLASASSEDAALHAELLPLVNSGRRTMAVLSPARIEAALQATGTPATHPLAMFAMDPEIEAALEDAVLGGEVGLRTIRRRRGGRTMSAEEGERLRRQAEQNGADGEALVNAMLEAMSNPNGEFTHVWASKSDPYGPYDFRVTTSGGQLGDTDIRLDVKSTAGPFERDFHMSSAEIREAAESAVPYEIWRIYGLAAEGALMRRSGDIRELAKRIVSAHDDAMPAGVRADGYTLQVGTPGLQWSQEIELKAIDSEDSEEPY